MFKPSLIVLCLLFSSFGLFAETVSAENKHTVLSCILKLQLTDSANRGVVGSGAPASLPTSIYDEDFVQFLKKAKLTAAERAELEEAFRKQYLKDLMLKEVESILERRMFGGWGSKESKLSSELSAHFSQEEVEDALRFREEALRDEREITRIAAELNRRRGQTLWYGYLLLSEAAQLFPQYLPHITDIYKVHIPGSLLDLTQDSSSFKAFAIHGVKEGMFMPSVGPHSDAFMDGERVGEIDTLSPLLEKPEIFLDVIKHLSAELAKTDKIVSSDKSYNPGYHTFRIAIIASLLEQTSKAKQIEIHTDPVWKKTWGEAVQTAVAAIQSREKVGYSDYPPEVSRGEDDPVIPHYSRPELLNALFSTRQALGEQPWQDWYIHFMGVERALKLLPIESANRREEEAIRAMPKVEGMISIVDGRAHFELETWKNVLIKEARIQDVLYNPYPDDLVAFRKRVWDQIAKVPSVFPEVLLSRAPDEK